MALAFPFSAIVGQEEMKLALLIAAVDPTVGGVLVFGDRGTGKSTAVRALAALLPEMQVVVGCRFACDPAAEDTWCDECRERAAKGPLTSRAAPVPVVDLPLGVTEDRVVGALDLERALSRGEKAFEPGLLARANRGFLYIDEVNLLEDHIVDLLIDVAASGENVVEREGLSVRHPARFVLVGSGNPEEGELRPQLLDRFGLSVEVKTPPDLPSRIEVVRRRDAFDRGREAFVAKWRPDDASLRERILAARARLAGLEVSDAALARAAELCMKLGTDGLRAELTLIRAARALACLDGDFDDHGLSSEAGRRAVAAPPAAARSPRRGRIDGAGGTRHGGTLRRMSDRPGSTQWSDAALAAALFAVDPERLGGVAVKALAGPVRDRWLELVRDLLPTGTPLRRIPMHVADGRLLGGLDLTATLRAGRPVAERGILAEADGGVVLLAMAERIAPATAARLAATLDTGEVVTARDGVAAQHAARVGMVAFDESMEADERPPAALLERLAFHVDLGPIGIRDTIALDYDADEIAAARERIGSVTADDDALEALCATAMALGIASVRAPLQALQAARVAAALDGRDAVTPADAAIAARLVLAPRATVIPIEPPPSESEAEPPPEADTPPPDDDTTVDVDKPLADVVLEAAKAAIPPGLLALLRHGGDGRSRSHASGRAGALQKSGLRGRPAGVRRGEPRGGTRLNVVETLRAAAPWQPLRRRERAGTSVDRAGRVDVRPDDFHVTRHKPRTDTTTIFVVDASGSSALNRMAEAKGAVELLLADCYVRRDRVAVLAFRGRGAELILPPTRSLVRAKRSLAGLPGGGGTPLAAAIDAAGVLAMAARRRGETPSIVLMTDGRANIARDGTGGRQRAELEAMSAARQIRAASFATLLVDTSPRPQPLAHQLANEMGALYLPLPYANASTLSTAIRLQSGSAGSGGAARRAS